MDDVSPAEEFSAPVPPAVPVPAPPFQLIAPWWHTALILLMFALWVTLSHFRPASSALGAGDGSHLLTYLSQMWLSWMLLGATVAGLYRRRNFFRITLTQAARPWPVEVRRGALTYVGLYVFAVLCIGVLAGTHAIHMPAHNAAPGHAADRTTNSSTRSSTPLTPPPEPAATKTSPRDFTHLFDNKAVRSLAPVTGVDLLCWFGLSLTAAFVEEHVFRGYLLWQTRVGFVRLKLPVRVATILAVVLTSMLFGTLHLYEGIGAAAFITCLGALYCIVTLQFSNLRAVIVAHFLQDFLAGLIFFVHALRVRHGG